MKPQRRRISYLLERKNFTTETYVNTVYSISSTKAPFLISWLFRFPASQRALRTHALPSFPWLEKKFTFNRNTCYFTLQSQHLLSKESFQLFLVSTDVPKQTKVTWLKLTFATLFPLCDTNLVCLDDDKLQQVSCMEQFSCEVTPKPGQLLLVILIVLRNIIQSNSRFMHYELFKVTYYQTRSFLVASRTRRRSNNKLTESLQYCISIVNCCNVCKTKTFSCSKSRKNKRNIFLHIQ